MSGEQSQGATSSTPLPADKPNGKAKAKRIFAKAMPIVALVLLLLLCGYVIYDRVMGASSAPAEVEKIVPPVVDCTMSQVEQEGDRYVLRNCEPIFSP